MFDVKKYLDRLDTYVEQIRKVTDFKPEVAIVLGSGLGDFAEKIEVAAAVDYEDLPGFPRSTAPGHEGRYVFGTLYGVPVVVLKGRVHYYEGYEMEEVVLPLRVARLLGAKSVLITNAIGGINEEYEVGDFMAVRDCISSFVPSPLRGPNLETLGERFTDVSQIYDEALISKVIELGKSRGVRVHRGVLIQTSGPQFETASEIKMFKALGADGVGMSSVVDAIACRHMGMKVFNLSCITNMATGISKKELSLEEVFETTERVSKDFAFLAEELIKEMKS